MQTFPFPSPPPPLTLTAVIGHEWKFYKIKLFVNYKLAVFIKKYIQFSEYIDDYNLYYINIELFINHLLYLQ